MPLAPVRLKGFDCDIPPRLRSDDRIAERHRPTRSPGGGHRQPLQRRWNVSIRQRPRNEARRGASAQRLNELAAQQQRDVRERWHIVEVEDPRVRFETLGPWTL